MSQDVQVRSVTAHKRGVLVKLPYVNHERKEIIYLDAYLTIVSFKLDSKQRCGCEQVQGIDHNRIVI